MIIKWTILALSDLNSELFFISKFNKNASKEIANIIKKKIRKLEIHPFLGRKGVVE